MLSKKVHVLVFYPLLNWKMHGETMKVDNNCVRCSRSLKACNEPKLMSQLFHTIICNFRKAVQILDIVQGFHNLPKWMNIFLQNLHSILDIRNITKMKDLLTGREIYTNLRQDHAKTRNCSETQVAPIVLNKAPNYGDIFISSCIHKIYQKWDIACLTAVGI